jgi:hypothetical protein
VFFFSSFTLFSILFFLIRPRNAEEIHNLVFNQGRTPRTALRRLHNGTPVSTTTSSTYATNSISTSAGLQPLMEETLYHHDGQRIVSLTPSNLHSQENDTELQSVLPRPVRQRPTALADLTNAPSLTRRRLPNATRSNHGHWTRQPDPELEAEEGEMFEANERRRLTRLVTGGLSGSSVVTATPPVIRTVTASSSSSAASQASTNPPSTSIGAI